jgi:hypothetical protein
MIYIRRRVFGGIAIGMCLATLAGCRGENRAAVEGKVTLDGTAIDGAINFVSTDGKSVAGASGEIRAGHYSFSAARGPVVGTYRVEVRSVRKTGKVHRAPPPANQIEEWADIIPVRYNSQSELKAEIKPGENQVDFDLKTK